MSEGYNGFGQEPQRQVIFRSQPEPTYKGVWLQAVLFILTVYTTTAAGMQMALGMQFTIYPETVPQDFDFGMAMVDPTFLALGIPFSITMLCILGIHEMGHYLASRAWRVRATLPYFIPFPSLIGTMGAVIKIKSRIPNRRALMDIGASGPLVGFVVSVLAMMVGMGLSQKVPLVSLEGGMEGFELGRSMLSIFLERMIIGDLPEGYIIYDHPIFVAGWVGLFVTALNLLPVGQFDGGHIVYAIFGRWHYMISRGCVLLLAAFWALGPPYDWLATGDFISEWWSSRFPGWLVWIFLAVVLGRKHPPPSDPYLNLDGRRKFIGYVSLAIFVLCFIPIPITIVSH